MKKLRDNLFLQFSAISFAAFVGISILLVIILSNVVKTKVLDDAVREAVDDATGPILQQITPADFQTPMTGERYARFDDFLKARVVSYRTARVKLWAIDGTVIYSNDKASVGQAFPDNENLLTALGGENTFEIKIPEAPENEHERFLGTLIEVYTPVFFPGTTVAQGVLEIYQYYEPTAQLIGELRNRILTMTSAGFIILYFTLMGIVWKGWRTILRQRLAVVKAGELLSDNEAKTRAILDTAVDCIITVDESGTIEMLNPSAARAFNYTSAEAIGQNIRLLIPEFSPARPDFPSDARPWSTSAQSLPQELTGKRSDGRTFPLELNLSEVSLADIRKYTIILRDITQRKELEAEVSRKTAQLQRTLLQLKDASLDTIYRLAQAAEYKDNDTGLHIQRISDYAVAICHKLGLDEKSIENMRYAAPMHDIGKIGIPDEILLKPGALSPAEWEVMKKHTIIGGNILSGSEIDFIKLAEVIALTHHEKWDGSGYPRGLKGEDIPLAGRITAVVDVFDALTSDRPYKEAFSLDGSFHILEEGRGRHFDPEIVDALISLKEEIAAIKGNYGNRNGNHEVNLWRRPA